jgi:cell division protein FtsB
MGMSHFIEKQKTKRRIIWIVAPLLFILCILFLNAFFKVVIKKEELDAEQSKAEQEILDLKTRNDALREFIVYLKSPEFLSLGAKTRLGMKQPGEEVIVIKSSEKEEDRKKEGELAMDSFGKTGIWENPRRWWRYLMEKTK